MTLPHSNLRLKLVIAIALSITSLTAQQHASASTCSASDGSGCLSTNGDESGVRHQIVPATELLKLLSQPGMKPLKRAAELVRKRRVNVSEKVYGGTYPLVTGVVHQYVQQDAQQVSLKQFKARRQKILDILAEMFAAGADPNTMHRGKQALETAMEDGDIKLCRCLIKGGARLSDMDGFLYRRLAYLWGSSASATDTVKILISLREEAAAGNLEVIHRSLADQYLNLYEISPSMRKLAVDRDGPAAIGDYSRIDVLNILVDMLEALLSEFASAVDFQTVVAAGHRAESGRNVFHFTACAAPRSILAFARAAVKAGAKAAESTLHLLKAGNALGRTPFHIAATCSINDDNRSTTTFDALLMAAEELAVAARVPFESKGAFLATLPKDTFGLPYSEHMGSTDKASNEGITSSSRLPYDSSLSGGWAVSKDGLAQLDTSPPGRCDVLVLQGPLPVENFTQLVIAGKPALLRGEALKYKVRKRWKKSEFLKRHGKRTFNVGKIPYADVFGLASQNQKVHEYVGDFAKGAASTLDGADAPAYAFGVEFVKQNPALQKDMEIEPPILQDVIIDGQPVSIRSPQFYLGPPKSGAPFHFHQDAVNILAYGRKRWFLQPPAQAMYSKRPTAEWATERKSTGGAAATRATNSQLLDGAAAPWECVQEAGDVLYVPNNWAHATLNIEESIGVAYEFESPSMNAFE